MNFARHIALAGLLLLCAACGPRDYSEPQLPNGGRPPTAAPFPQIANWSSLDIKLNRTGCYGSCPSYTVEIRGDGTVIYDGGMFAAIPGHHVSHIGQANVRKLYEAFRDAQFFWLLDHYTAKITDNPTYTVSIAFDGRAKTVIDYAGRYIGMPPEVGQLEDTVDELAGTDKWVNGNGETFASLKSEGWDFHAGDDTHLSLIATAVHSGDKDLVAGLLAAGVPVSGPGARYGCYALEQAASDGRADLMRMLLAAGAPIHFDSDARPTRETDPRLAYTCDVLQAAAAGGFASTVQLVLSRHPDVNWSDGGSGHTALMSLTSHSYDGPADRNPARCAQLLIAAGANVNTVGSERHDTPLMVASDDEALTRVLLKAGAKVDAVDEFHQTALMHSTRPGVAQALLEAGADPWAVDDDKETAADIALREGGDDIYRTIEVWTAIHPRRAGR